MKKRRLARWATLAPLCLRRPGFAVRVAVLVLLHGRPWLRRARKAQKLLAQFLFTERLVARCPDRVVIHDDGFAQWMWSMLIDSRALRGRPIIASVMATYYREFRPQLIILEVDDATVAERVFGRVSKGRFNRDSSVTRKAEFGRWLTYHRTIMSFLPADLEVIRFDAHGPPETLAAAILSVLAKALGPQGGSPPQESG